MINSLPRLVLTMTLSVLVVGSRAAGPGPLACEVTYWSDAGRVHNAMSLSLSLILSLGAEIIHVGLSRRL